MDTLKKEVMKRISKVKDPEMNISIVDLGLVYNVEVDSDKKALITMTLTTLGCPLFGIIEKDIKDALKGLKLKDIEISLTFDPPWSFEKMSEKAKIMLGIA